MVYLDTNEGGVSLLLARRQSEVMEVVLDKCLVLIIFFLVSIFKLHLTARYY